MEGPLLSMISSQILPFISSAGTLFSDPGPWIRACNSAPSTEDNDPVGNYEAVCLLCFLMLDLSSTVWEGKWH